LNTSLKIRPGHETVSLQTKRKAPYSGAFVITNHGSLSNDPHAVIACSSSPLAVTLKLPPPVEPGAVRSE
jgi:hypothetical protein